MWILVLTAYATVGSNNVPVSFAASRSNDTNFNVIEIPAKCLREEDSNADSAGSDDQDTEEASSSPGIPPNRATCRMCKLLPLPDAAVTGVSLCTWLKPYRFGETMSPLALKLARKSGRLAIESEFVRYMYALKNLGVILIYVGLEKDF